MRARRWLSLLLLGLPSALAAQGPAQVRGRVLATRGSDTVAVSGARVVLHHVGPATQGPIDSVVTTPDGGFHFRFRRDSTANYLLSTRYADIEYFSSPVARGTAPIDGGLDILVFDTSSTAPVGIAGRTIVIAAPDAVGARTVIDWISLANRGSVTRISPDSLTASWGARLPSEIRGAGLGDTRFSQFSPEVVLFRNDSVIVTAPISPGVKELVVQYELPPAARRFELAPVGADSVDLFVEEAGVLSGDGAWIAADSQPFQGRSFRRMVRRDASVDVISLRFPGSRLDPKLALIALVGLLGLALAAATLWRFRTAKRAPATAPAPAPRPAADQVAELTDRIARLDATPEGERAADWATRRTELMDQLRRALAARRSGP
ncbi:MAG: hypothetical protein R2909_04865 [Gemmatimonadales bacterium]